MTSVASRSDARQRAGSGLRLWPGVAIVALQWLLWAGLPRIVPGATWVGLTAALGGMAGTVLVLIWWLAFSRAPWIDRIAAPVLVVAGMLTTRLFLDPGIARGNLGFQYYLYAVPLVSLMFVASLLATRRLADSPRRGVMAAALLAACGALLLLRSDGLDSSGAPRLAWRWTSTAEERLLADAGAAPPPSSPSAVAIDTEGDVDWPGFRGAARDGALPGLRIETDWTQSPPLELWRRPVGPGTSSFAAGGGLIYTQEQRGDDELVGAYALTTGEPAWWHRDATRHWDSHVGAGPRATPALAGGLVYALGATGVLNALDARDGAVVWSRNVAADSDLEVPMWGFTSSPLVYGDDVIVYTDRLVAYDRRTGALRWTGSPHGVGYSSPQRVVLGGTVQVVVMSAYGAHAVAPEDGAALWEHSWSGAGVVQPAATADGDLLVSMVDTMAMPIGTRRLGVRREGGGWVATERWTSIRMKPSFSSFVLHEGHVYGFDGHILACMDAATGDRVWKGGRYGEGQLLLLPDQDLLIVVTEDGELALVEATAERHVELARSAGIEGRTWNSPALAGDVLLVRNGEEMAAFRLSRVAGGTGPQSAAKQ